MALGGAAALLPQRTMAGRAWMQHAGTSVGGPDQSLAYHWLDVLLDVAVQDVERNAARPTVLARAMAIVTAAMYEAWVPFDARARGVLFESFGFLRRGKIIIRQWAVGTFREISSKNASSRARGRARAPPRGSRRRERVAVRRKSRRKGGSTSSSARGAT